MADGPSGDGESRRSTWRAIKRWFDRVDGVEQSLRAQLEEAIDDHEGGDDRPGNGDLSAAPSVMRARGWTGNATRQAALDELIAAKLVCITRQGGRRQCSLYAVTLWPMACDFSKLDHGPGVYSVNDWRGPNDEAASRPTAEEPATWAAPRKNKLPCPATGEPQAVMTPPRVKQAQAPPGYDPVAGSIDPFSASRVTPPRGTYLDKPSAAAFEAATQ